MIAAALWVALCVGLWWRIEPLLQRVLALAEQRAAIAARVPEKVTVPHDITLWLERESEPWAKEQTRALVREAYEELGDWALVRSRVGIAA